MKITHTKLFVGGIYLWWSCGDCVGVECIVCSLGCRDELRSRLWKWSVAHGECDIFHVRQHSNMPIARRGVLPCAFALAHGECLAWGLLKFDFSVSIEEVVLCRRRAVVSFFLQSRIQSRGADVIGQ